MKNCKSVLLMAMMLLIFAGLIACSPEEPADETAEMLQNSLDEWRSTNDLVGVTLSISTADTGEITVASGEALAGSNDPLLVSHSMYVGSVTKTFTAATVLQLVQEGELSLDDTIEPWFPDYPHAADMTIRQLLNMTSGTFDYFRASPDNPFIPIMMQDITHVWSPEEIVSTAATLEPTALPGEALWYSNTNYTMLGQIIEQVTQNSLEAEFHTRFYEPLQLHNTQLATPSTSADSFDSLAHGYVRGSAFLFGSEEPMATSRDHYVGLETLGWAAGGMVSTSADLAKWAKALYGGDILDPDLRAEMVTPGELVDEDGRSYGYGVEFFETAVGPAVGHPGSIPGFASLTLYLPEQDLSISVITNDEAGEPLLAELVDDVLTQLQQ